MGSRIYTPITAFRMCKLIAEGEASMEERVRVFGFDSEGVDSLY